MADGSGQPAQPWWRKMMDPAFLWGVLGAVVFYIWTAAAERERILSALTDHDTRLSRIEQAVQRDQTETTARMVTEAAERADIKATLLAMRDIIQRVEAQQREYMDRTQRLMQERR